MNRSVEDSTYRFRPPKYSRFWAPLFYRLSDVMYLHHKHQVSRVAAVGGERVRELAEAGHSLLLAPNHSDHSDPHVVLRWARPEGLSPVFMATREIFEALGGLKGTVLQRAGVFSVDRDGADVDAVRTAVGILREAKHPLVIFPEGEIYHLNERLTPLNNGVALIAIRAAGALHKVSGERRLYVVPTYLRFRYVEDVRARLAAAMDRLEAVIHWAPQRHLGLAQRVTKFGEAMLALKEREHLDAQRSGGLPERIRSLGETLLSELESRRLGKGGSGTVPERIRRLRGRIRAALVGGEEVPVGARNGCYRDLDTLFLVAQCLSYPGDYVTERPTQERIAETILKFEEDLFGESTVKGNRRADVVFCEPIDVTARVANGRARGSVRQLTAEIETAIRAAQADRIDAEAAEGS